MFHHSVSPKEGSLAIAQAGGTKRVEVARDQSLLLPGVPAATNNIGPRNHTRSRARTARPMGRDVEESVIRGGAGLCLFPAWPQQGRLF